MNLMVASFEDDFGSMRCGSLVHMVPCWGYCFQESSIESDPKKIVVLGDTCDSSYDWVMEFHC